MGLFGGRKARTDRELAFVDKMLACLLLMSFDEESEYSKLTKFERPDSRLRYEFFCLAAVVFACGYRLSQIELVQATFLQKGISRSLEEPEIFFGRRVDSKFAREQGAKYYSYYVKTLSNMGSGVTEMNVLDPIEALCHVLREIESPEPATSEDFARIRRMATMIWGAMETIYSS